MNKKGEVLTIFAGIVIVLTLTGAFLTLSKGNDFYVGDKESNLFYSYNKCSSKIEEINSDNQVIFESENLALKNGFKPVDGCI